MTVLAIVKGGDTDGDGDTDSDGDTLVAQEDGKKVRLKAIIIVEKEGCILPEPGGGEESEAAGTPET